MFKKLFILFMSVLVVFMSGCSQSKQIDTASLAETVTVSYRGGKPVYSFYIIGGENKPAPVSISAMSFEEAYMLAKNSYIPNLSLSKLEMFAINNNIYNSILKTDLEYISGEYRISPLLYLAICDDNTMDLFSASKDALKQTEEHILLLKKKDNRVKINSLSVFNSLYADNVKEFYISYLNSENELKAEPLLINIAH